jgi:long-chain fatty acid transport protein
VKHIRNIIIPLAASLLQLAEATEGINLIGVGPVQQGTAGAGVASAKASTWLVLNPAGLTQIEKRTDASIQYFAPRRTLNSGMSGGAGQQTDDSGFFIPSISASLGCCNGERGYVGLGLYGTSGMGVDYDYGRVGDLSSMGPFGPTAPQDDVDQMTQLSVAKLILTYAQELDNGWSVGAGPVFVLSLLKTDMLNSSYIAQSGKWDSAVGLGFIFGVNKQITDRLTIGGSYLTEQFMTEFDEYNDLLDGSLNLPQQLTIGLAYNILNDVEVALDYRWIGWEHLDTLGDQFGWEDQNIVKAGLTWAANEKLTLRGGISHGNSPIGNGPAAFNNALFPAIMETHLATGFSYQFDSFRLDFAYTHGLEASRYDPNTATDISMSQNSLTLGAGWEF